MNRRKTIFVRHDIQGNYLKLVALAMLTPTLLVTACLYYLIWETVAYELALPELIASVLIPAFHRVNRVILIGLPIICAAILFFAIRLSHRLAGPLYRIEKELDTMVRTKNFTKPIRIRPHDHLQELTKHINRALKHAHER